MRMAQGLHFEKEKVVRTVLQESAVKRCPVCAACWLRLIRAYSHPIKFKKPKGVGSVPEAPAMRKVAHAPGQQKPAPPKPQVSEAPRVFLSASP